MTTSIPRHAGPSGPPMTVPTLALFASVTAVLAGGWLVLAPFALGYQPTGADWADASIADLVTGLVLLALGAIATVAFAATLIARLRPPRPRSAGPIEDAATTDPPPNGPDGDLVALLRPLIAALERDDTNNPANPAISTFPARSTGTPPVHPSNHPSNTDPVVRS